MSLKKRIIFGLLTVLLIALALEGIARVIVWREERKVFGKQADVLKNDQINFMKEIDLRLGYKLKPGFSKGKTFINEDGFAQRSTVPRKRVPGKLRVIAMGESTTQGHGVDNANYPIHLQQILEKHAKGYGGIEMINAGVAGWVSGQVATYAETKVAAYRPDVVVLYVGWNDFQSYCPLGPVPSISYFEQAYGVTEKLNHYFESHLKSVAILTALYRKHAVRNTKVTPSHDPSKQPTPEQYYRFYLQNLDRILVAFRKENPKVKICISTLVGRWPHGTQKDFDAPNGHIWWMEQHKVDARQAAELLGQFNQLIRQYAIKNDLVFIDAERAFDELDRSKFQHDFAHMSEEGYELLAETIFDTLQQQETVTAKASPRKNELRTKYELDDPAARVADKEK